MVGPSLPTDSILSEKARRIAGTALDLLEKEVGAMKAGTSYSLERIDALSNVVGAVSGHIGDDENDDDE